MEKKAPAVLSQCLRSARFLEFLARAEGALLAGLDLDRFAGRRFASHAGGALAPLRDAEPADADAIVDRRKRVPRETTAGQFQKELAQRAARPAHLANAVHADVEDVRGYLRRALPALAEEPLTRSAACMYTMTPDANFIVGALGDERRVIVLAGFSGHGFKMASAMGEIATELATKGRSTLDIALFDPARLQAK